MPSDGFGGATAAGDWLDDYPAQATSGDLYSGASAPVAQRWREIARGMADSVAGDAGAMQEQLSRQITELGLTFRITGDEHERNWPLTAMPLVIGSREWSKVERGLIQRAELLEALAADIYGPQRLVTEGRLPAAVIAGSPHFARKMLGQGPASGHYIHVYAADLARGPKGEWRVLQDRVRLATGIGYALENRVAMTRATNGLFRQFNVRRLPDFFSQLREGIARDCQREHPRVALLTPGRFNQTYPEQAHLARYLGLPLVEGRDLVVTDDRLYVRTIAGPKRIDAIWRWINTNALDPLTFDSRSQLGVPDLFGAWARGGLEIANCPGVEVLESSAFSAFMPRLCRILLNEEPLLPTVATWWCGQAAEARTVRERIGELALVPAFGQPVDGLGGIMPVAGAGLDESARAALFEAMGRRPMDYCGQEIVHLSTAPAIIDGTLAPRPFTVRAFLARSGDGSWIVMPGGFARLSSSDEMPTSMMGEGDLSADVCILDEESPERPAPGPAPQSPPIERGGGILASQAADNLFWFGRYNERAEMTVRIARSVLGSSMDADGQWLHDVEVRRSLVDLLYLWNAITPATANAPFAVACGTALAEAGMAGGVTALVHRAQETALSLRERFAYDFWRIVRQPMPAIDVQRTHSLMSAVTILIERFSALSGLTTENMVRGSAWRFLDMGRRLERALSICRVARQLSQNSEGSDAFSALLDLCDSQIVYSSRYLAGVVREPVMDLVVLDPDNPRSLVFQIGQITEHLEALPTLRDDNVPERPMREARALLGMVQSATADMVSFHLLNELEARLLALSDAISSRYFLQFEQPDDSAPRSLLG